MLCTSWTTLVPFFLVALAVLDLVLSRWFHTFKTNALSVIVAAGCAFFYWVLAPDLNDLSPANFYMTTAAQVNLDHFVQENANMLLTGAAVVWLMRRAWQTLWKPVPELISILGVDVPDAPDVMLAGIGVDKATVNWARPQPNKPVQKFLIQVNGVVGGVEVGESPANQETAITVTGLKPDHFYNVRVIAVGSNNFQAGSRVIRLRTFAPDGRPQLGNSRLPPNFELDEQIPTAQGDGDENGPPRSPIPSIEMAGGQESGMSLARESSAAGTSAPRRNTIGRRHSPSTGSMDQRPMGRKDSTSEAEVRELGEKFTNVRREAEETAALIAKEEEDNKRLLYDLEQEKQRRKADQKKKEEQTEKLKKEMGTTERSMRSALQKKAQREKELKAKQNDRSRYHDNIAKWQKQIEEWRKEQASFIEQKKNMEEEGKAKVLSLRECKEKMQDECSQLETQLKEKREQVKQLEDERKKLPGGEDDAEWREMELEMTREWQKKQHEYLSQLHEASTRNRHLDDSLNSLHANLRAIPIATGYSIYDQTNSSGADFDSSSSHSQLKHRSHHSNSLSNLAISPLPQYATMEPVAPPLGFHSTRPPPGFAHGPYLELSAEMPEGLDEDDIQRLTAGAPLSPSAAALLPSNIFMDDDSSSPTSFDGQSPFAPMQTASPEHDPQSPASGRSMSIFSSPHGSAQNLPHPQYSGDDSEQRSLKSLSGTFSSPVPTHGQPAPNKLSQLFSWQRRGANNAPDETPPALGSLKSGQSQSFPRQTDDPDVLSNKRRISLSHWNVFNRNSVGPDTLDTYAPPPGSKGFSARNLLPFASKAVTGAFDRDTSSPRPASIASSDLPRPSTDSGSIWAPSEGPFAKSRRVWSPDNNGWPSRNPSRRPSVHGSPSALKTTLASAEDEILDDEALQASPSQVGVIGSRPLKKSLAKATLNPAAPAFLGSIFGPKSDKANNKSKDKTKDTKDKIKVLVSSPEVGQSPSGNDSAERSDSRMSRDAISVHTQASISESHESFSLDHSISNTPSEPAVSSINENVVRKLFRKSSSGFSFTTRLGKKGPGSVTNSDKNMSGERSSIGESFEDPGTFAAAAAAITAGEDVFGRSYDSVTSSPALGSVRPKDGRMKRDWFLTLKKKGKERESLELDREKSLDTETPMEE